MSLARRLRCAIGARRFSSQRRASTPEMKPKAMLAPYSMNSRQSSTLAGSTGTLSVRETTKDMTRIETKAMPIPERQSTAKERFSDGVMTKPKPIGSRIEAICR